MQCSSKNNRMKLNALLVCAILGSVASVSFAAEGDLDKKFGVSGKVITDIAETISGARAVAFQADNKIVVVGSANGAAVVRYNTDGSMDTNYNYFVVCLKSYCASA